MSTLLETLQADLREVLAHLAAFPKDEYAKSKRSLLEAAIFDASTPEMSHQRKRAEPRQTHEQRAKYMAETYGSPVPKAKDFTEEWKLGQVQYKGEGDGATRYTFGADYEMDQLWLEAEREKAAHPMMVSQNGAIHLARRSISPAEPDKMMFPVMSYDLTSWGNVKFGTKNY